jgi:hypothetical protein
MHYMAVALRPTTARLLMLRACACLILTICYGVASKGQNTSESIIATGSHGVRATHILGFAGARKKANGTLSIQADTLQFQSSGKLAGAVRIASVQDVVVGEMNKQVGGLPMTMGKAAAPYGGGRVLSLFAHKKYDSLAVEYEDADGGIHGAIFQLHKGEGELLRKELVGKGARVSEAAAHAASQRTAGVTSESK